MLACGKRTLALVCNDMTARACGDNVEGQLGMGTTRDIRTLRVMELDAVQESKTLMIAASNSFVASVDIKGQVWISGMFAEVVDKPDRYKMQILDMKMPKRIIYVAAGHMHCLALSEDMHVFAAGKNWSGQLGVGDANVKYTKQLVPVASGPWDGHTSMITCGACFSAILTDDGRIRTFGQYSSKCLGVVRGAAPDISIFGYTSPNVFAPTIIAACDPNWHGSKLPPVEFLTASAQQVHVIANGVLYAWGQNCCGQLGLGRNFEDVRFPKKVGGEDVFGSKVRLVAANEHHTLVLTENRDLWAYGNCEQGRLGLDRHENCKFITSPQMLEMGFFDSRRIACIAAGKGHSAVLTEDGNLYTWGQGRLNEWRSVVPSALGYAKLINFQPVPRLVEHRMHATRSSGEQMKYGIYSKLPLQHIIAFLMGTHKRLGSSTQKSCLYLTLIRYDEFLLQLIVEQTSCDARVHKTYAKFPALRKMMGDTSL
jgi:hypothetical protein